MLKATGSLVRYPAQSLFVWYFAASLVGGLLLCSPWAAGPGAKLQPISFLDGLFTAVSALCVTGLTVRSTPNDFSLFGQILIMILIQIGGLGIMTFTGLLSVSITGRESMRHRAAVAETLGIDAGRAGTKSVFGVVIAVSVGIQSVAVAILFARFLSEGQSFGEAAFRSLFTTVSAYCNAGFALADDNLMAYLDDWVVNLVVMSLVILGGIGFPVINDVIQAFQRGPWYSVYKRIHLHTRLVVSTTLFLLIGGAVLFWLLERHNTLANQSISTQILASMMQSTSTRTAGFNTVDVGQLTNATLFFMILAMFIGAAPCSTGGGVKVTTFAVLILRSWHRLTGRSTIHVGGRSIGQEIVDRALGTVILFAVFALVGFATILLAEQATTDAGRTDQTQGFFVRAGFEVISALGTVGLSTGITAGLSDLSKLVLIGLMFVGRIGPITMVVVLARPNRPQHLTYPKEEVLIG